MTETIDPTEQEPDAERVLVERDQLGGPVDPPDEHPTLYATIINAGEQARPPIVPAWMRNPSQRRTVVKVAVANVGYHAARHVTLTPKYAGKVALYAPVGVLRGLWKLAAWTLDFESFSIRQHAASRNNYDEYHRLSRHRDQRVSRRLWVTGPLLLLLAVAVALLVTVAPWWSRWLTLLVAAPALAWVGRPADKPIIERTVDGSRFTRLTGEMVRAAVVSLGVARVKEPGDISFPPPGIHRDGPGWLARFNLPAGVEAVEVLEKRGRLSSALRLPVDQVWPSAGPEHAGQVDLWVGYVPSSKMGQPRWSLASPAARTSVFHPEEFGSDQRQRPVRTVLFARNFLIGGVPGSGKSYGARTLATIAALDPTAELKIVEFKGTADFGDFAPICSTYACGVTEVEFGIGAAMLRWGLVEAERRGKSIKAARERGEAPEGKVTPELAARPGSGLHPVVFIIDEAHELFGDPEHGKDAARDAERLIKRGRALGLIVILATQIPDKDSLPPAITRCVTVRWCMAVQDQVANDMILGTGAYKRGVTGTAYRPGVDAGWGMMTGLDQPTAVRSQYPDEKTGKAILARAAALRGRVVGEDIDAVATRDVLDDVIRVFATIGRPGVHWQTLAALLGEVAPEAYADTSAEVISAQLRALGVASRDVKDSEGVTRKGCRRTEVEEAVRRREIGGDGRREVTDGR
jgi:S-DNA-T family DNA segregation ATPase FtsK/SpoIIIE